MPITVLNAVESYRADGFVHLPRLLAASDLDPFRQVINRGVDAFARKLHAERKIADLHEDLPFDRRLAVLAAGNDLGMRAWDDIALSPELFHLIGHPRILDAVETLVGPEITFNGGYHLRPKLPESKLTAFPWHQDSQYYGEPTKAMHIVTVTIPLVDLTEENGCLWMIPGSQKWGYLAGARGPDENIRTFDDVEKRGTPIPIPMRCGDILVFSNLTFHASKLNVTNRVRWTLDFRFTPSLESRRLQGISPAEQAGYEFFFPKLRAMGHRPILVRSGGAAIPTYEQWISGNAPTGGL